jgi:PAS domain S-box-containing protein
VGILKGTDYVYASESLATIHGYETAASLVGRAWPSLYAIENPSMPAAEVLEQVQEQGVWRSDAVAHRPGNSAEPVEVSMRTTGDEIICAVRRSAAGHPSESDETARVHGGIRDRQSIDTASAPIAVVAQNREFLHCNAAAVEFVGAENRQAVLGRPLGDFVHDRDCEQIRRRIDQVLKTGNAVEVTEFRLSGPDTRERIVTFVATPIRYRQASAALVILNEPTGGEEHEMAPPSNRDTDTTLTAIAELLFGLTQEVVECPSRETVEETVCDRLTSSDLYESAGIYAPDVDGESLQRRFSVGGGDLTPELESSTASEHRRPSSVAQAAFETNTVRATVGGGGTVGSALAIPLSHETAASGVLVVRSDRRDAYGKQERAGLAALGGVIGFLITALRRRALMVADTVVELAFQIEDPRSVLLRISEELDCALRMVSHIRLEENWLLYLDVEGAPASEVFAALETTVEEARVVSDKGQWNRVECVIADTSLVDAIVATGALIRSARADQGTGRVVVEAPPDADLHEVVAQLRGAVWRLKIESVTEHERTLQPAEDPNELFRSLTDRQREAITAAYQAGYFDWPRQSTAEEVAETLDIAAPTFHAHLRKAELQLFAGVFGSE